MGSKVLVVGCGLGYDAVALAYEPDWGTFAVGSGIDRSHA